MNQVEQLIHDLRHNEYTKGQFDMGDWAGKATCGTVGCIAGTVIARKYKFDPDRDWYEQWNKINQFDVSDPIILEGTNILGIDLNVGRQLFVPKIYWLDSNATFNKYIPVFWEHFVLGGLGENEKPSRDYIAELHEWAKTFSMYKITPEMAANATEQVAVDKQPWVDWMAAVKKEEGKV